MDELARPFVQTVVMLDRGVTVPGGAYGEPETKLGQNEFKSPSALPGYQQVEVGFAE